MGWIITLSYFTFTWPCIATNFLKIKPSKCSNSSNLFWNEILRVSESSSAHHQELFTVHSAMVYVTQICRQVSSRIRVPCILILLNKTVWHTIAECTVNSSWWWTEELSETCRVSSQNKFEKLVHLVGFVIKKRFHTQHGKRFCPFRHMRNGSGNHHSFIQWVWGGGSSLKMRLTSRVTSGIEVTNAWMYTSTFSYVFMPRCLIGDRENLICNNANFICLKSNLIEDFQIVLFSNLSAEWFDTKNVPCLKFDTKHVPC
jgi:hypothetical protein